MLRSLWLKLFRRRNMERDLEAELAFHREMAQAAGNSIPFGHRGLIKEQALDLWRFTWAENLLARRPAGYARFAAQSGAVAERAHLAGAWDWGQYGFVLVGHGVPVERAIGDRCRLDCVCAARRQFAADPEVLRLRL